MREIEDFIKSHECSTCQIVDGCAIQSMIAFVREHEHELDETFKSDEVKELSASIRAAALIADPLTLPCRETVYDAIFSGMLVGYWLGRTYQTVPKVFEEA